MTGQSPDKAGRIAMLAGLLAPGGRLLLVEPVPRLGERLLAAQDWSGLPDAMARRVLEAEEAVYADQDDPMVNWDDGHLVGWCENAGLRLLSREVVGSMVEFPLGEGLLERWFGQGTAEDVDGGKLEGRHAGRHFGKLGALLGKDAERVRRHLEQSLGGKALRRKVAVAFVMAAREE
jgi:putative ATPase